LAKLDLFLRKIYSAVTAGYSNSGFAIAALIASIAATLINLRAQFEIALLLPRHTLRICGASERRRV
jgi:hypothetical protein